MCNFCSFNSTARLVLQQLLLPQTRRGAILAKRDLQGQINRSGCWTPVMRRWIWKEYMDHGSPPPFRVPDVHPISKLIDDAHANFAQLMGKRSLSIEQAAHRYRERRGRHPPPGFDAWFEAAKKKDAIIVEEFFDRVHHDINPFWALDPLELIRVRGGKAEFETDDEKRAEWIQLWTGLVKEMMPHLPDLDMVVNVMDETRILVPWEKMNEYVAKEASSRELFPVYEALTDYTDYFDMDLDPQPYEPKWIGYDQHKYWDYLSSACPPDSPARSFASLPSFNESINDLYTAEPKPYTYNGFIQNFTAAHDPCIQPHLRGMHGTFVESVSMSTLKELFPMFGGSKLPQNNELLIPGGMYLTKRTFYSGGDGHGGAWEKKTDGLIWRGIASGGRNKPDNWWHFHRHRFVQMMNGSTVSRIQAGEDEAAPTFRLPPADTNGVVALNEGSLGEWLEEFSDVGFVNLQCFPGEVDAKGTQIPTCPYVDPYMAVVGQVPMQEQYNYKFLPDVDGNSYSARWRGFLMSTSCPLKSTIYTEWHDDRLIPWVHFVPFDNTYDDIYAIMDYLMNGHDAEAQRIAEESSEWAAKVLRRDDMLFYVWRLLLEYARVVDPHRDRLAFVGDLTGSP
ncbi:glycosyl transferase family 90-domain-containing protein [Xylariales sp. AK1849]|nr:glycosyl transferase family 90-domain-containing protein [Xylariales sp. AK1849]